VRRRRTACGGRQARRLGEVRRTVDGRDPRRCWCCASRARARPRCSASKAKCSRC
jgi:hypothetical protein